jgi:glycosyltransferase involved in cell wall biosynthesis
MKRIVCFGPGPKFKGGISNYNTSLAKALDAFEDTDVHIISWTQQYPAIIPRAFVDKSSKLDFLAGTDIKVQYITNYNNPLTWNDTVNAIVALKPDIVIFQWSIAIQGIPLGYIARRLKKHKSIEVIFDLHFVVQKENSSIDRRLTRWGIIAAQTYITHAYKTVDELKSLFPNMNFQVTETGERPIKSNSRTVIKLFHPIYDLFKPQPHFNVDQFKKEHGLKKHVFLFFGFIRKYKGLHHAIEAFHLLSQKRDDISLVICGESFWNTLDKSRFSTKLKNLLFKIAKSAFLNKADDEKDYNPLELIKSLGLEDKVLIKNEFVANEDVHKYFQVSDVVLLFYLYATPSGVESLTYNFKMPIVATRVGHFPETIKNGFNGYLAEPGDISDMARVMDLSLNDPIPRSNVESATYLMSWENYARAILSGIKSQLQDH